MESSSARTVTTQILTLVYELPGALEFLECLMHYMPSATLVGGAVRDLWINPNDMPADLDVMVDDDELYADQVLDALGEHYEVGENNYGNPRIELESMHVDLFSPGGFRPGFSTIVESIENFDCTINAVGIRLHDMEFLDPVGGTDDLKILETSLIAARWGECSEAGASILLSRLSKLMKKFPVLLVKNIQVAIDLAESLDIPFPEVREPPEPKKEQKKLPDPLKLDLAYWKIDP